MRSRNLGLNLLGTVVFCLIIIGYFYYKKYQEINSERVVQKNLDTNFFGTIDSMYIDSQNHGWLIIVLSTKEVLRFNGSDRFMYEKNDSIVKRKGEDSIYIYRDGMVKSYKY
ncbi:hypothetical protein [Riemerella anatipestifer]|uniref:hypothetical protein n=1 Tax=Riemerella anatipestifer TaxID=34085 RepID=UPI001374CAAF|nr:hypothetical protein [Riemerella anatipestifer]